MAVRPAQRNLDNAPQRQEAPHAKRRFHKIIFNKLESLGYKPEWDSNLRRTALYFTLPDGTRVSARLRSAMLRKFPQPEKHHKGLTFRWRIMLNQTSPKKYSERLHPTFWIFLFDSARLTWAGMIIIPDCVLPEHWKRIHLAPRPYWIWKYWRRWDCLATYPDVPADLLRE